MRDSNSDSIVWRMSWPETYHHAQIRISDKDCAIKELVVLIIWDVSALGLRLQNRMTVR